MMKKNGLMRMKNKYFRLIASRVVDDAGMSIEEIRQLNDCELEELILPHLNYIEIIEGIKEMIR